MIFKIGNSNLPQFQFEWHPGKKKVYVIRLGTVPEVGEVLAHDIENRGAAINAVLIWSRGFNAAQFDRSITHRIGQERHHELQH